MIDTCQANTMYSKFYSPNIIATGSSEIHQSSYSHHADNDVGVAVIDRYTYYNLDFLETQVLSSSSKKTLGDLFDSYDEEKIHSHPGLRWDLFPGGEMKGRERLVMDFFGNVQGVEVEGSEANETRWQEDMAALARMFEEKTRLENHSAPPQAAADAATVQTKPNARKQGAAKIQADEGWTKQIVGASALLGCAAVWWAGSWLEKSSV